MALCKDITLSLALRMADVQARSQEFAAGGATISVNGVKFLTTFYSFLYMFSSQLPPTPCPQVELGGQTWKAGGGGTKPPWLRAC
jgi:hypothetical protein